MGDVVVGVDGSEHSRWALHWATYVGERTGRRVRAVQAWEYPAVSVVPGSEPPADLDEMDLRTAEALAAVVREELAEMDGAVECSVLRGPAAGAILEAADDADLLVLGSRGRGGFRGLLLGSVSRQCVEHAGCPVLIARGDLPATDASPIVVGVDGSPGAEQALRWAYALADAAKRPLVVTHAWRTTYSEVRPSLHERLESEARARAQRFCDAVHPGETDVTLVVAQGDPRDVLSAVAERQGADLIVVGRRGEGPLRALRIGSVANHLLRAAPRALAVIPPGRE
jgi:nucleotide-binding universal stress UspA family protein